MKQLQKVSLSLLFIFVSIVQISSQNVCILQPLPGENPDEESMAAFMFMNNIEHFQVTLLTTNELNDVTQISEFQLIWFHHSDTTFQKLPRKAKKALNQYVLEGGKLILSQEGARAVDDLELENIPIEVRNKKAEDSGYGRKLGMHAFRSHPVFEGLQCGSYIFKPYHDTTLRIIGFFEDNIPKNGKVIAVDWDYIFLREKSKLMLEYTLGQGKILVIGAYVCLSEPNLNQQHLRKFIFNCLNYIIGGAFALPNRYWSYRPQKVILDTAFYSEPVPLKTTKWPEPNDNGLLNRNSENQFWDVAGEGILVMGHENGGIDEIWAHPFMALKDYRVELRISDSIIILDKLKPEIEVRPNTFRRIYRIGEYSIKETIMADESHPVAVVHYSYRGTEEAELVITFNTNLRFMWPYSENVIKELHYGYDENLNAFSFHAENDEFNVLVGSNKKPIQTITIQDANAEISAQSTNFEATGSFHFKVKNEDELDILISADHLDLESCRSAYINALSNTQEFHRTNADKDPLKGKLRIISPDPVFNEGYDWAIRATDRFMTHTPGLGTSLVAGIGTTQKGWDGGHTINGRPGYAWYFGRDGQWSGLAILDYGDFENVKKILQMYQNYQDLNGKIYHEVSTSGIVHFDASDATPLYIILAGRYLQHSGDLDFIRKSWFNISKALEYCYSTDTDEDHLIENTNVGHGWVEGGGLFGSHSSLYLSACWAEALEAAAYMARALDNDIGANYWEEESEIVKTIIKHDFWNAETGFLNQGKFIDGTYHTEPTIMPAIPIYFEQVDPHLSKEMLPVWASDLYSSDWGCRIVSKESEFYNPRGYHTGSVWPLFTGWVALAEYTVGNSVQGFTHIMNNLLVYRHWGLGFIEEVLNGETYQPSGVCHHQCWSETMVLQPAIEGMLGLNVDAVQHFVELAPQLPAHWDSVRVENIRIGEHVIHLKMVREKGLVNWTLNHTGPSSIRILFDPKFEPGTLIKSITSTGDFEYVRLSSFVPVEFFLEGNVNLHYKVEGGIGIIPHIPYPEPGATSNGIRVIEASGDHNTYSLNLEGLAGHTEIIQVFARDDEEIQLEGGKIIERKGPIYTIEVTFAGESDMYVNQILTINTGR